MIYQQWFRMRSGISGMLFSTEKFSSGISNPASEEIVGIYKAEKFDISIGALEGCGKQVVPNNETPMRLHTVFLYRRTSTFHFPPFYFIAKFLQ